MVQDAAELQQRGLDMIAWSYARGWDAEHGGIYYFLDRTGRSPVQLVRVDAMRSETERGRSGP